MLPIHLRRREKVPIFLPTKAEAAVRKHWDGIIPYELL
jgi:hypothetical protein